MKKIVIISTCAPQKCGLATFTNDLKQGIELDPNVSIDLIAVCKLGKEQFDSSVRFVIDKDRVDSYIQASCIINEEYDYCILQHEFGIFGGADGIFINNLINNLNIPLLTVFHTILQQPSLRKKEIMESLLKKSHQIVSLSPKGCSILKEVYPDLNHQKIKMIPHGVPQFDYNQALAKRRLGLESNFVIMTFGLMKRSKNLEFAIKCLVGLDLPDFKYFIVGKTHPDVLASEGESYRYELQELVTQLQLQDKVIFVDEFLSEEQLKEYLTACDIYLSPYQHKEQTSSGTLSFAVGAGTAVIATPYWHAKDLLIDDRGILTPFNDVEAMRDNINLLYNSPRLLAWYRFKAQSFGEQSTWKLMARNYVELLSNRKIPIRSLEYFENYISFDMRREA